MQGQRLKPAYPASMALLQVAPTGNAQLTLGPQTAQVFVTPR